MLKLFKMMFFHLACLIVTITVSAQPSVEQIVDKLDQIRSETGVAAVGIAIVVDGKIVHEGALGTLEINSKTAADKHTLFRLGSITKSFTGLSALRAQRRVPALLEQPINKTIPGLIQAMPVAHEVRLENLLEHTAGLSDLSRSEFAFQGEFVGFEEAIDISPSTRIAKWPVNSHSSYSNAGYGLAGYVLEQVSGMPFEQLVKQEVLDVLGMHDSGFYQSKESQVLAAGYDTDGKTTIPYWHMLYRSFGGLNSTPADMATFLRALVDQDKDDDAAFLTAQEQQRFESPTTTLAARAGLEYGYGLGNYHWFRDRVRFHGHGGDADGYLSHYGYNRQSKNGYFIVITAFKHASLKKMRNVLEDYLVQLSEPEKTQRQMAARPQLKQWVGTYEQVTHRFARPGKVSPALKVQLRGDTLSTEFNGVTHELIPVKDQLFRRAWQPEASYAFIKDDDGTTYFQGDIGNFKKLGTRRR